MCCDNCKGTVKGGIICRDTACICHKTVQTRSETHGLNYYETLQDAFEAARKDNSIWKISFSVKGERVRLVRRNRYIHQWIFEPLQ